MSTKREQTRTRILQAAWQLFQEQGYQNSSTRAIARAAGVADGTVFSHFKTKLDMLKAGILVQVDTVVAEADRLLRANTPEQRLLHYASHLYPFYAECAEFSRELFKELLWDQQELRPQIQAFIDKLFADKPSEDDRLYGQILMDLYFMTLLEGLGEITCDSDRMLAQLGAKLDHMSPAQPAT